MENLRGKNDKMINRGELENRDWADGLTIIIGNGLIGMANKAKEGIHKLTKNMHSKTS